MIVIAIMGIVLTMGVPIIYRMGHEAPLRKAVQDIVEVCSQARAMAIMQSKAVCVVFHGADGRFEIQGAASSPSPGGPDNQFRPQVGAPSSGSGLSGQLGGSVAIEKVRLDRQDCLDTEEVKVWFYPNGVCDELTLILFDPSLPRDPRRAIWWEVSTSLANVESDPVKVDLLGR